MKEGPFAKFLKIIAELQSSLGDDNDFIRTALVTARDAPSHERVIKTLRYWGVRIDEMFFLGGLSKTPFYKHLVHKYFLVIKKLIQSLQLQLFHQEQFLIHRTAN